MVKRIAKILIPTLLIGFLIWNIGKDWRTVAGYWDNFRILPFLLSFAILLIDYPEGALGWHMVLRKMGINVDFWRSHRVWIIATTSRYIPGSIWQYIGRVELAQKEGIPRNKTLISLLIEAFMVLVAGVFMATLALPFLELKQLGNSIWVFFLPLPLLLLHPNIANKLMGFIAKVSKRSIKKIDVNLDFKKTVSLFPWFAVNFLINGAALYFLVMSLTGSIAVSQLIAFTGFYSLAWVIGYVALFAPAGVGVTEVSLAYLLSFSMPLSLASVIALSYRVFLTTAELAVFLFVLKKG